MSEENQNVTQEELENPVVETEKVIDKDEFIAKLNNDLLEQKKKTDEYFEHLKRSMAEFDNYKKRMNKEKQMLYTTIKSDVITQILPIMDTFEKAVNAETTDQAYKSGMEMIYNQLKEMLENLGLEEIECIGQTFDPEFHEAVMHVEDENFKEKEITEVFRKGYKLGDKIIRHSMVKVAN